jgi:hypothetical protein
MCEELRRRRYSWLRTPALFFVVVGGMSLYLGAWLPFVAKEQFLRDAGLICLPAGAALLGAGLGLLRLKRWLWRRYDPNIQVSSDRRMSIAQERAMTEKEFARKHPWAEAFEVG